MIFLKKYILKNWKINHSKMKGSKYLFFMLILVYTLINISGTNSPKEIRNLEPINDGKRTLSE